MNGIGIWGTPLAKPASRNLVDKLSTTTPSCAGNAMLPKTFRQMMAHNETSWRSFSPGFKISENLWKSLKTSENVWKPLQEKPPGGSGRNFPEDWAKPLRKERNFWKPDNEPHVGPDWIGTHTVDQLVQGHCKISSRYLGYPKPCTTVRLGPEAPNLWISPSGQTPSATYPRTSLEQIARQFRSN